MIEQKIRALCQHPFFKMILKEWSLHVKTSQDPYTFANMYLEMMRDPLDDEGRQATTLFLNFIKPRPWTETMRVIEPKLEADVAEVFRSQAAEQFYNGWRDMVVHEVQEYWTQFLIIQNARKGEEPGPRDWSPRAGICTCGKFPWKCTCKKSN